MNKTLKERILEEMLIDNDADWALAKEIYEENKGTLKEGIGLSDIYCRIRELREETKANE